MATAVDEGRGAAGVEQASAAGVVEVADGRIRFSHPLLGSVVYASASPSRRRALHARLAEVVDDPDERARGTSRSLPPVPTTSGGGSGSRCPPGPGARGTAGRCRALEQARRLTPPSDSDGWRRAVEAGECHLEAGDTERARALLEDVVARLPPGQERAIAITRLAWVEAFGKGFHVGADLFRTALAEIGDDSHRVEIEPGLAWSLHEIGDLPAAEPHARAALELAERSGRPALLASALEALAFFETIRGRGVPTALIERALELDTEDEWRSMLGRSRPAWIEGMLLSWAGDPAGSRTILERLRSSVVARGDDHSLTYVAFHLGRVECLAGNWELAARYADECFEMMAQTGQKEERPFALTVRALVVAHVGRVDDARGDRRRAAARARSGRRPAHLEMLAIRGFLEHSLGDAREAHRFLGPLPHAVADAGFGEPALFRFHGDAIETLLALGDPDAAATLLDELDGQARATGRVWAHTIGCRSRALVDAAAGKTEAALAGAARALELHEELEEPFELARTLFVMGTLQRRTRQKRAARESLTQALAMFDHLGARLWSEKAHAELGRIGGRAPAPGALTPTEERVAGLVAAGHTYREVADALFISPKTVQWNLSKIYRKLGIRSRAELAAKLAAEQTPAVPPVPE